MEIKDIIKDKRLRLGLTMKELSEKIGVSEGTISRWESGDIENMKRDKISLLAQTLSISLETLMGWDEPTTEKAPDSPFGRYRIPVLATVAAGTPLYSEESIIEWIDYDRDPRGEVFGLRIKGDSMMPKIQDGDTIIIDKSVVWDDNDIVVVTVNGNDGTCKRVKRYKDGLALVSLNPAYEPIFFTKEQIDTLPVTVIGRVVESRRRF